MTEVFRYMLQIGMMVGIFWLMAAVALIVCVVGGTVVFGSPTPPKGND